MPQVADSDEDEAGVELDLMRCQEFLLALMSVLTAFFAYVTDGINPGQLFTDPIAIRESGGGSGMMLMVIAFTGVPIVLSCDYRMFVLYRIVIGPRGETIETPAGRVLYIVATAALFIVSLTSLVLGLVDLYKDCSKCEKWTIGPVTFVVALSLGFCAAVFMFLYYIIELFTSLCNYVVNGDSTPDPTMLQHDDQCCDREPPQVRTSNHILRIQHQREMESQFENNQASAATSSTDYSISQLFTSLRNYVVNRDSTPDPTMLQHDDQREMESQFENPFNNQASNATSSTDYCYPANDSSIVPIAVAIPIDEEDKKEWTSY